jgi:hypothetical protein
MKRIIFLMLLAFATISFAQFKDQLENRPKIFDGMIKNTTSGLFLGFINPENFHMQHSFSMSYSASGSNGLALGVYTNSMSYKFNDKLNVQLDASLVNSPYSSFGKNFANQINGIYISKAALNYSPFKNFHIDVQYSQNPFGYYYSPYGYSGFSGSSMFSDFDFDR